MHPVSSAVLFAGAAPMPPSQSVRDPHAAQQHVCVDAGVCGRRARHHGEEPQHPEVSAQKQSSCVGE